MKNSGFLLWVIVLAGGFALFQGIMESGQKVSSSISGSTVTRNETPAKVRAGIWPYLSENNQASVDSNSLLRKNYYLIVDGSGSMEGSSCLGEEKKITIARRALQEFFKTVPVDTNIGLLAFDNNGISERATLATFKPDVLNDTVNRVNTGGGTPLRKAMKIGYDKLTQQAKAQLGYGEYHLVVVTDGEANGGENPEPIVKTILAESPVVIHTIGFCIGENHSLNQPGKTIYRSAGNLEELKAGLQSVLAESSDFQIGSF